LSSLGGLWADGESLAVHKLKSVVHYVQLYLKQVSHNGMNIIYSIPIVPGVSSGFSLTSVAFQVVSKTVITVANRHIVKIAPVILVTGMCGDRPLPNINLQWSEAWVVRRSYGTVILSCKDFLEGSLLSVLNGVNAKTTVLPRFPSANEDEFGVYLSTLENHPYRKNRKTEWQLLQSTNPAWREYGFEHRDEWSYEHKGSQHDIGAYSVVCE
jgi:hypothetical protein